MARGLAQFSASFLIFCGGLVLLPGIDLWASALFYRPGTGFFLRNWPAFQAVHEGLPDIVAAFALAVAAAFLVTVTLCRSVLGLDRRAALFLLASLALGPGLVVNTVFKDHWGRARPAQIVEFGGTEKFTPAFVPSNQCDRNCSFPAGDPSIGFYLVSVAFLVPDPWWRRRSIAAALALGTGLGFVRMAQGGHFLSDVVAAGFLVYGTSWLLYQAAVAHDGITRIGRALRHPSSGLKAGAWLTLATAFFFALSYFFVDQPVARYFQDASPRLIRVFSFVTRFGQSGIYLVPLAAIVGWGLWNHRQLVAARAAFVFVAVALPGLIADIIKPVFGRARPRLLIADRIYGFSWHGADSAHWSFPSGHSVTVAALAAALYVVYPPLWPVYALAALLVAASRIIVDAHYLSDVIAGLYLGFVITWILAAGAKRKLFEISDTPRSHEAAEPGRRARDPAPREW